MRAEFLRARNFDYVKAAHAIEHAELDEIISKRILPKTLFDAGHYVSSPFASPAPILELSGLDFLNLGVPSPTPSLGGLLRQAKSNVEASVDTACCPLRCWS